MKVISFEIEIKGFKTQITNSKQLEETLKAIKKQAKEIDFGTDELQNYNKAQAQLQFEQKKSRDEIKKQVKELQSQENSYRGLSAELTLSRNNLKDFVAQQIRAGRAFSDIKLDEEYRKAARAVNDLDEELKDLDQALGQGQRFVGLYAQEFEKAFDKISGFSELIPNIGKDLSNGLAKAVDLGVISEGVAGGINKSVGSALSSAASLITPVTVGIGAAALGVAKIGSEVAKVNEEFDKLNAKVKQTTGLTDEIEINFVTGRARGLAETFDEDFQEILTATNNFAKNFELSFDEAFDLVQTGFQSGANVNGDFLNQLREYPSVFQNIGFSAEEFIKLTTQQVQDGIFDDKLIDTIKELDLSLKELTKTQEDALNQAFGEEFTSGFSAAIAEGSLTTRDALIAIANQAQATGLDIQQTQVLTADLFKGAGEDAGGFGQIVESVFSALEKDYDSLVDETDDLVQAQNRALEASTRLATAQSDLADSVGSLGFDLESLGNNALAFIVEQLVKVIDIGAEVIETIRNNELAVALWDTAVQLVKGSFEVLVGVIRLGVNLFNSASGAIRDFVAENEVLSKIAAIVRLNFQLVVGAIQQLPAVIGGVQAVILQIFDNIVNGIKITALEAQILYQRVRGLISDEANAIADDLENQKTALENSGQTLSEAFQSGFDKVKGDTVIDKEDIQKEAESSGAVLSQSFSRALESINPDETKVKDVGKKVGKDVAAAIQEELDLFVPEISPDNLVGSIEDFEVEQITSVTVDRNFQGDPIPDIQADAGVEEIRGDAFIFEQIKAEKKLTEDLKNDLIEIIVSGRIDDQDVLNKIDKDILAGDLDSARLRIETEIALQEELLAIREEGLQQTGQLFEDFASGQLASLEEFKDASLQIVFDQLSAIVTANISAAISQAFATLPPFVAPFVAAASAGLVRGLLGRIRGALFGEEGLSVTPQGEVVYAKSGISVLDGGRIDSDGVARGRRHGSGGIKTVQHGRSVEIEDGESVQIAEDGSINTIKRESTKKNYGLLKAIHGKVFPGKKALLNQINQSGGGIRLMQQGGSIPRLTAPHQFAMEGISINGFAGAPIAAPANFQKTEATLSDTQIAKIAQAVKEGSMVGSKEGTGKGVSDANDKQAALARFAQLNTQ